MQLKMMTEPGCHGWLNVFDHRLVFSGQSQSQLTISSLLFQLLLSARTTSHAHTHDQHSHFGGTLKNETVTQVSKF